MKDLSFNSGLVTYNVNGVCEIQFNPTDAAFVDKIYQTFEEMKKHQESINTPDTDDIQAFFAFARTQDTEMRRLIDGLFGKPVCAALFPDMNIYAMADGLPVWCNFFMAIFDEIDVASENENKKSSNRIKKYTDKYRKKRAK